MYRLVWSYKHVHIKTCKNESFKGYFPDDRCADVFGLQ